MLTKEELLDLGYEIKPDPDQPGRFLWRNDQEGSDISYDSEAEALAAATEDAKETHDLYRCANCNKVRSDQTLVFEIKKLTERILPGDTVPEGKCPECGAFCYRLEDGPDWETVMDYFGLDSSFCWTAANVEIYTKQYLDAMKEVRPDESSAAKAIAFVQQVARLLKHGELGADGKPYEPDDIVYDSHDVLMNLIDDARAINTAPDPSSISRDWKKIAGDLASALDACVHQIGQMQGLFDDDDGTIQAALDGAKVADSAYLAAFKAGNGQSPEASAA